MYCESEILDDISELMMQYADDASFILCHVGSYEESQTLMWRIDFLVFRLIQAFGNHCIKNSGKNPKKSEKKSKNISKSNAK